MRVLFGPLEDPHLLVREGECGESDDVPRVNEEHDHSEYHIEGGWWYLVGGK